MFENMDSVGGRDQDDQEFPSRYKKTEMVGKGTYGKVHKAIDTRTGETVAIKKMIIHVAFLLI